MSHAFLSVCALVAIAVVHKVAAETSLGSLNPIFGRTGAVSPLPPNKAQYILDLEAQGMQLHYHGDQQIFLLALSPKLRQHLQTVASEDTSADMPTVYGVSQLSGDECDWSKVPGWLNSSSGADAQHVFYGREIRRAPGTQYGNAIHLSLGPDGDPEGWTGAEMQENFEFWQASQKNGESVGVADRLRKFRDNTASGVGGTFEERWGTDVTTKAHRFTMQMYTAESQGEAHNPGGRFFEMFRSGKPPTTQVVFFEAEDGCKGTPTPKTKAASLLSFTRHRADF